MNGMLDELGLDAVEGRGQTWVEAMSVGECLQVDSGDLPTAQGCCHVGVLAEKDTSFEWTHCQARTFIRVSAKPVTGTTEPAGRPHSRAPESSSDIAKRGFGATADIDEVKEGLGNLVVGGKGEGEPCCSVNKLGDCFKSNAPCVVKPSDMLHKTSPPSEMKGFVRAYACSTAIISGAMHSGLRKVRSNDPK
jgi:hypothetical protein